MIKVVIPSNNIEEREYLLDVLFNQFLKVTYKTVISQKNIDEYQIYIANNKCIIIKDAFFSIYPKSLDYLKIDSIPKNINYFSHPLFVEQDLPILFGIDKIDIEENRIVSHIDIFATIFFMLTRWEEYVESSRDEHNRFPHTASLAYKNGFLDRPIVNEYIEFMWNMFLELGYTNKREDREFSMLLTHDVDEILRYPDIKSLLKRIAGDIVYRRSPLLPFNTLYNYALISQGKRKDPYDSFDYIMDISDACEIKSHFFFMSGGTTDIYDNRYEIREPLVKEIIANIKERGHYIGLHPSYNSYNNKEQFRLEKEALSEVNGVPIISGREHYLRFQVPDTWQLWEDNSFEWCSNMAYPRLAGFRTGSCYPYTPFNIITREQLSVIERPLIMMEATFIEEADSMEDMKKMSEYYFNIVKKYRGEFVLLWHNASFGEHTAKNYTHIYEKIIQKYKALF